MATCGFCKTKGLQTVPSNSDGKGLETHTLPRSSRTICEGMATAPGFNQKKRK